MQRVTTFRTRTIAPTLAVLALAGCGGTGEDDAVSPVNFDPDSLVETTIFGSVGDGPITAGTVVVESARGRILATQRSDEFARYRIELDATVQDFPLTISVDDGTDLVSGAAPAFRLVAAVTRTEGEQIANLNPHGTVAVGIARRMDGGLTAANLAAAADIVRRALGFGIDARPLGNPVSSLITKQNVASVVRASEALGEAIRRTHVALQTTGNILTTDELVDALSADLVDGVVDGRGAAGAEPRIAATAHIASAQVLLETMANRLRVGAVAAAPALDAAIQQVMYGDSSVPLTGTLNVTDSMLTHARATLEAAARLDSGTGPGELRDALAGAGAGMTAGQMQLLLEPVKVRQLDATIEQISLAGADDLSAVNDIVSAGAPPLPDSTNRLPTISGSPGTEVMAGEAYVFAPTASDADGDTIVFSATGLPGWAQFDAAAGQVSGAPGTADAGTSAPIQITASDGFGSVSLPVFRITVTQPANRAPTIAGQAPTAVTAGNTYAFTPVADDADGDALSFSVTNRPAWASFDTATGRLTGRPGPADAGAYTGIRISVSDGSDRASLGAFTITVSGVPNRAPTISGTPPAQVVALQAYRFVPVASDGDGDPLQFTISGKPPWAGFDPVTGTLSGTPAANDAGDYTGIRIGVTDGADTAALAPFPITVIAPPNQAPSIAGTPDSEVTVGQSYAFAPSAADPDGDTLTFGIEGRPVWASFSSATGELWGTPDAGQVGTFTNIRITVTDGADSAALAAFGIVVNGLPNRGPTISGAPPDKVTAGSAYEFVPSASDPDGDVLTYSITGKPGWAQFTASTGRLSGTPSANDAGSYSGIVIRVTDGEADAALAPFAITVNDLPNRAPTISGAPATQVTANQNYAFTPQAADADGDPLSFSISGLPGWASFDTATGRLSGTPGVGDVGDFAGIRISVSDGKDTASLPAFAVSVASLPNRPPLISGTPPGQVMMGEPYDFTPAASDPDQDDLGFTIVGKPSWAAFDSGNGRLSGTPQAGDEGSYAGIVIRVSDGEATASLPAFTLTVAGLPNQPPSIAGSPGPEVVAGSAYSFTPTADDPDGDNLTFTVTGLPGWASFDPGSGRVFGTPQPLDVASYDGIRITVSDGEASAELGPFSIAVVAQTLGTARLNWDAPVASADGSVLDDLAGFRVYWGPSVGNYPNSADIANPGVTTYFLENLVPGRWYFVVTAYDHAGNESIYSNVASKDIVQQ